MTIPPTGPVPDGPLLIGDVAELTGLSLRSIRHYEELGLVKADSRTAGGFRVFGAEAVERLRLVMMLRVMDLSLDEILPIVDVCRAAETGAEPPEGSGSLEDAHATVKKRLRALEERVSLARSLTRRLRTATKVPGSSPTTDAG
ncbi:MerR family DNA-binding transcriptional regulator [Granulicoccus sp. GXG6511]|uniref:helix-turn-helix domain-containing protein n=1 Tax=Granulicoccus sp. GXG6511 TaxID=3381351 RepID=UPI003D7DE743